MQHAPASAEQHRSEAPALELRDLHVHFDTDSSTVRAVDGLSLRIDSGERLGIAGESGSGKTQTLLSVMGLVDGEPGIVSGRIRISGSTTLDTGGQNPLGRRGGLISAGSTSAPWKGAFERRMKELRGSSVAMIFQEPRSALAPYMTAGQQLEETIRARLGAVEPSRVSHIGVELLEQLRFSSPVDVGKQYPHTLSGGECQRIMIALALVGRPDLILADEPTSAVDADVRLSVLDRIVESAGAVGSALVIVSHDLAVLSYTASRLIVMFAGRAVESGPVDDVLAGRPARHPYTSELLEAALVRGPVAARTGTGLRAEARSETGKGCPYRPRCPLYARSGTHVQRSCREWNPELKQVSDRHEIACWGLSQ